MAPLAGMIFHGASGRDAVSIISELEYVAKKGLVSEAIKAQPQGNQYPKLITAREMDDAMSLDSEVPTVLRKMKRKRFANDSGEAASSKMNPKYQLTTPLWVMTTDCSIILGKEIAK